MLLLNKYEVKMKLGKGVWFVERDNSQYAVKQIDRSEVEEATPRGKGYLRLLNAMKNSKGDYLVRLVEETEGDCSVIQMKTTGT